MEITVERLRACLGSSPIFHVLMRIFRETHELKAPATVLLDVAEHEKILSMAGEMKTKPGSFVEACFGRLVCCDAEDASVAFQRVTGLWVAVIGGACAPSVILEKKER